MRIFEKTLSVLNALASIWVLLLMALISGDVFGRGFFNRPISGIPEIVKFSIVAMVWLQMAYVLRRGGHLKTTLLYSRFSARAQQVVSVLNYVAGFAIFGMIAWFGGYEAVKSWTIGAFEGAYPVRVPIWPIWGILVLGAALSAVECLLTVVRVLRSGASEPETASREDGTSVS